MHIVGRYLYVHATSEQGCYWWAVTFYSRQQWLFPLWLQATVKEPAIKNMKKGISMAYALITSTYFTVAVSGYWAFGQTVMPYLLNNLSTPTWPVTIANIAAIIQITGCYQVRA